MLLYNLQLGLGQLGALDTGPRIRILVYDPSFLTFRASEHCQVGSAFKSFLEHTGTKFPLTSHLNDDHDERGVGS